MFMFSTFTIEREKNIIYFHNSNRRDKIIRESWTVNDDVIIQLRSFFKKNCPRGSSSIVIV